MRIKVIIRECEGTFYATSEAVPGLVLCSKDLNALDADTLPALKLLLSVKEQHQKQSRTAKKPMADRLVEVREFSIAA